MEAREFTARVMASGVEATIVGAPSGTQPNAASSAAMWSDVLALLTRLELRWSRFLDDSDISRLNRSGGRPVVVDPSTITLLSVMLEGWRLTQGRFDPSILPALLRAGYTASIDDPRRITILPAATPDAAASMSDIEIDSDTVTLPAGLALDPGGIGKGLAADLAVDRLIELGAAGALVSIGGDMTVRGTPPDRDAGWTVAVERPGTPGDTLCTLALDAGAIATSSTRSRRWIDDRGEHHHAIDPRHRAPSLTDLDAVTVIDRSGWLAEVHATAALLEGSSTVIRYLEHHGLSGLAVTSAGGMLATGDLADDLHDHAVSVMTTSSEGWFR